MALMDADALDEALNVLRTGLAIASRQGRGSQVPMYQIVLARVHLFGSAWDDAEAEVEAAVAAADAVAAVHVAAALGLDLVLWTRGLLAEARGDVTVR
jgi:hypothetical protein